MPSRGAVTHERRCGAHELAFAADNKEGKSDPREEGCAHAAQGASRWQSDKWYTGVQHVTASGA